MWICYKLLLYLFWNSLHFLKQIVISTHFHTNINIHLLNSRVWMHVYTNLFFLTVILVVLCLYLWVVLTAQEEKLLQILFNLSPNFQLHTSKMINWQIVFTKQNYGNSYIYKTIFCFNLYRFFFNCLVSCDIFNVSKRKL